MARVLVLAEDDVEQLLPMRDCIEVMERALADLAGGRVHQPLRQAIRPPGAAGLLGLMPAWRNGETPLFGLKEVCVFPANPSRGLDTHLGAVLLHSGETGELLAIMNASAITAIRTAAVSAVATRLLAPQHARTLAIIGTGVQARKHMESIPLVREIEEIFVAGRSHERAATLAAADERARVATSVESATSHADIVVTATSSRDPVLMRAWVRAGSHVNAVGSSVATARELESSLVANSAFFVDRRESTLSESGDFLVPMAEGLIDESHIRAEIGDVLAGKAAGRTRDDEITIFKSLGLAIEDLAVASHLFGVARARGAGTHVEV